MIYRNLFPGGKSRALTLSYDDGVGQDVKLMGILREHGMKATFNLDSGKMGVGGVRDDGVEVRRMLPDEVKEAYLGFEVAVHGYTHPFLTLMPKDMMAREVAKDREELEKLTGYPVRGMAYPYGAYNEQVIEQLRAMGIAYARTANSTGGFSLPKDFLAWHPTCHHNAPDLMELCDRFLNKKNYNPHEVFYLWGHSYEFDADKNWDAIERFCDKMALHEDIWYATNIEIYDYIDASNRLISSCDGRILYNPSAIDVWVTKNGSLWAAGEKLCVPAGKVIDCGE
ncbi:MAG: polysaccharide deacetylase family protein [Clostridia bacterium]|nr:polysaccharide deacetylase family protein [Clostridia bacterium]